MRFISSQFTLVGLLALALGAVAAPACGDGEVENPEKTGGSAGKAGSGGKGATGGKGGQSGQSGQSGESGMGGSGETTGFPVVATAAKVAKTIALATAIADVVELGDIVVGLHEDTGASILDLSDPENPQVITALTSTGQAVSAVLDSARHIAYVLSATGEVRAWQVADPTHPVRAKTVTIGDAAATALARVGDRLFVVGKKGITPVTVSFKSDGSMNALTEDAVAQVTGAVALAMGAGQLYVTKEGGDVDVWDAPASGTPKSVDSFSLGNDVVGMVARGTQLFAAIKDVGLKVVDFAERGKAQVVYEANDVNDVQALRRSGNMVVLGLAREVSLALDVSTLSAPRALAKRDGALPKWMVASNGNLVLGSGKSLSVLGVPPFVSASVPNGLRNSFPRYGRIPLQLSKPVDPSTLTNKTVTLTCGGKTVSTSLAVRPDNSRITLLPKATLPAGADCSVDFNGVQDALGLAVSSPGPLGITTSMTAPGPVESPKSSYPHSADGAFTDWKAGAKDTNWEYGDVTAAQGMYSKFYADYDGKKLWILNDWFYNGDAIEPDCYNQFEVYTGGGTEVWDIRAYGDQHIEVRKNGTLLEADDKSVTGGYSHAATPNDSKPHTVYEIGVTTAPGAWSIQLSDPGPTFACTELETDPTTYDGQSDASTSSVDPTHVPTMPAVPTLGRADQLVTLTPTLSWSSEDTAGNFTQYLFELARGKFGAAIFKQWVYGQSITLPAGLLQYATTYAWRVTGTNLAGNSVSEVTTFSIPKPVVAPVLSGAQPLTLTQNTQASINLVGTGFVEGAQAFLDDQPLNTMWESDTALVASLSATDTATTGTFDLTVRNAPDDATTASEAIVITIQSAVQPSDCPHSECMAGGRMPIDCSPCATELCGISQWAYCCNSMWDAACAEQANVLKSCTCDIGAAGQTGSGGSGGGSGGSVATGGQAGTGLGGTTGGGAGGSSGAGASGGSGGATCAANCWETYPLSAGPPLCDDASMTVWSYLHTCACTTYCASYCPLACTNMGSASTDGECLACIYSNCNAEYIACENDGGT